MPMKYMQFRQDPRDPRNYLLQESKAILQLLDDNRREGESFFDVEERLLAKHKKALEENEEFDWQETAEQTADHFHADPNTKWLD